MSTYSISVYDGPETTDGWRVKAKGLPLFGLRKSWRYWRQWYDDDFGIYIERETKSCPSPSVSATSATLPRDRTAARNAEALSSG